MPSKAKEPTAQEVHEAGQNAHRAGRPRSDNPFEWSTKLSQHWLDGWDQVEKDING